MTSMDAGCSSSAVTTVSQQPLQCSVDVSAMVNATVGANAAVTCIQHGLLSATEASHADLKHQIARGRAAADAIEDDFAACAATFSKLPAYTEKVRLMTTNLRILRENVSKLRGMAAEIGADASESLRGSSSSSTSDGSTARRASTAAVRAELDGVLQSLSVAPTSAKR